MSQAEAIIESICNRTGEGSYRRGVSQALALAANLAQQGCTWQDLARLADESLEMREDHKPHPAYIDELMARQRTQNDTQKEGVKVKSGKVETR